MNSNFNLHCSLQDKSKIIMRTVLVYFGVLVNLHLFALIKPEIIKGFRNAIGI